MLLAIVVLPSMALFNDDDAIKCSFNSQGAVNPSTVSLTESNISSGNNTSFIWDKHLSLEGKGDLSWFAAILKAW